MSTPQAGQRWERPEIYNAPPGFWKRQLPGAVLSIAASGVVTALRQLLQEQPETLNQRGPHGRTLLWEAARAGRIEAVRLLLKQGADVNLTGCYNSESVVQITPYCAARYYRREAVAGLLKSHGAHEDVFRLAFLGDTSGVRRELDAQPDLLNAEDPHDPIYFTPLIAFAVAGGHDALARAVIERGAALAPYSAQLFSLAAKDGNIGLIDLLLASGADVRAIDAGIYIGSHLPALRRLIDAGAPVNTIGKNGFPPLVFLSRADKGKRIEAMRLLIEHGADVNAVGPHGRAALHNAAESGNAEAVKLLLAHGANREIQDDAGRTPLKLARAAGRKNVLRILRTERQADGE